MGKPWESHGKAMGKQWIAYPLRLYKTVCELEHLPLIVDLTINSMVIFHSYSGFSYWKWPLIVDLTIKHGDFPIRFLELFTRPVVIKTRCRWLRESQRESQSVSRAKLFGDKKKECHHRNSSGAKIPLFVGKFSGGNHMNVTIKSTITYLLLIQPILFVGTLW